MFHKKYKVTKLVPLSFFCVIFQDEYLTTRCVALHAELEKIRAKQRILGRLLTDPNVLGRAKPMACNKYLLRGIATSPDVVYVCKREPEQLIDLEDGPRSRDQWWRLAYVAHDVDEPVKAEVSVSFYWSL